MPDADGVVERARGLLQQLQADPGRSDLVRSLHFLPLDDGTIGELLPQLRQLPLDTTPSPLLPWVRSDWEWAKGDRELARRLARGALGEGPASDGVLPQVLLIGAPKSGTTSLLAYLEVFPELWRHPRKELHFFDGRWPWGEAWYRLQFPSTERLQGRLAIEATPDYLQDPQAPQRAAALMPEARLIVLLREPLRRALSWFQHRQRLSGPQGRAEDLISAELHDLLELNAEQRAALGWRFPNCLAGSLYVEQLQRWRLCYEEHQILMLRFEDLVLNPSAACQRVARFLGLPPRKFTPEVLQTLGQAWNVAPEPYPPLSSPLAGLCRRTLLREALELWQQL
jgi:hypothetical protein